MQHQAAMPTAKEVPPASNSQPPRAAKSYMAGIAQPNPMVIMMRERFSGAAGVVGGPAQLVPAPEPCL